MAWRIRHWRIPAPGRSRRCAGCLEISCNPVHPVPRRAAQRRRRRNKFGEIMFLVVPVVLSFLLAAAHWLHAGNYPMVLISLLAPFLLLVRSGWVVRVIQVM